MFSAAALERVPRGLYPPLTYLLSNQPQHQHLLQSQRDQTTNRPQTRLQFARAEPRPSWTKRGIGDLEGKPPPWSPQQPAKQPDRRPPFFLPTSQLANLPLDFPLRQPIFGRDTFRLSPPPPPPPTPSLRRALKWPPWPPDPHRCKNILSTIMLLFSMPAVEKPNMMDVNQRSAQMVPLPTNSRWGYAEGWGHAEPGGTRLEQILAGRALARIQLRLSQPYPRDSQRADIDKR